MRGARFFGRHTRMQLQFHHFCTVQSVPVGSVQTSPMEDIEAERFLIIQPCHESFWVLLLASFNFLYRCMEAGIETRCARIGNANRGGSAL